MGINLTALTVFGGALVVSIGFGLQSIASNFISGLIILLDGSLKVGDFIELDDGRSGTIVKMNIRSTLLETYSGKDIIVPNEQFITTRFVNWTHNNPKQRYSIEFQVAYKTDIPRMLDIIKEVVRSHPQVLNEPDTPIEELADAEISGFGDSGIDILVEFWMEGIDDGVNRVGADLLLMIWQALRDNNIEIPFPQREVKILNPGKDCSSWIDLKLTGWAADGKLKDKLSKGEIFYTLKEAQKLLEQWWKKCASFCSHWSLGYQLLIFRHKDSVQHGDSN